MLSPCSRLRYAGAERRLRRLPRRSPLPSLPSPLSRTTALTHFRAGPKVTQAGSLPFVDSQSPPLDHRPLRLPRPARQSKQSTRARQRRRPKPAHAGGPRLRLARRRGGGGDTHCPGAVRIASHSASVRAGNTVLIPLLDMICRRGVGGEDGEERNWPQRGARGSPGPGVGWGRRPAPRPGAGFGWGAPKKPVGGQLRGRGRDLARPRDQTPAA